MAAAGAWIIRPGNLFGVYSFAGVILSLALVFAGFGLRAWGSAYAGGHTRGRSIEAPRLATGGPYAHVRNPIYLGNVLIGFGMVGLLGDPWLLPLCLAVLAFLYFPIIPAEEEFLLRTFGDEYRRYREAVPRLWPRLRPWPEARQTPPRWKSAAGELPLALLLVVIYVAMQAVLYIRK